MEFFAWLQYDELVPESVYFVPLAKAPNVSRAGSMLFHRWSGDSRDDPSATADAFAELLTELRRYYVTEHQYRHWYDGMSADEIEQLGLADIA